MLPKSLSSIRELLQALNSKTIYCQHHSYINGKKSIPHTHFNTQLPLYPKSQVQTASQPKAHQDPNTLHHIIYKASFIISLNTGLDPKIPLFPAITTFCGLRLPVLSTSGLDFSA